MKILFFLLFSLLFLSCSRNKETNNTFSEKEKIKVIKDSLPRIEFVFPGEDFTFSIGAIDDFDTTYSFTKTSDAPCGIRECFVYSNKNTPVTEPFLDGMKIDTGFIGIIFMYPKFRLEECHVPVPTEYTFKERSWYSWEPVDKDFTITKLDNMTSHSKYDTINNQFVYHGSVMTDSSYLDFSAFIPLGDSITGKKIWSSIKRLKIEKYSIKKIEKL